MLSERENQQWIQCSMSWDFLIWKQLMTIKYVYLLHLKQITFSTLMYNLWFLKPHNITAKLFIVPTKIQHVSTSNFSVELTLTRWRRLKTDIMLIDVITLFQHMFQYMFYICFNICKFVKFGAGNSWHCDRRIKKDCGICPFLLDITLLKSLSFISICDNFIGLY